MSLKAVVFGHSTIDNVIRTDGSAYFGVAGGAGMYAASGASLWCANKEVGISTKLGKQFRKDELESITSNPAMDASGLVQTDRVGIKLWMLFDDDGYRHWVLHHDACTRQSAAPDPDSTPRAYFEEPKGYHFSPLPTTSVEALLEHIQNDRYIQLDPHYEWFFPQYLSDWKRILPRLNTILPSEDELCKFFDISYGRSLDSLKDYAKRLSDMGPSLVVVKLGERGAMVYNRNTDRCILVPSCASNIVDPTGAGDTFGGSFLISRLENDPVEISMIKGAVGASITLEHQGVTEVFRLPHGVAEARYEQNRDALLSKIQEI
ncbi:MAG: carbohydrate kinase family protein [Eubacteriales bacterium]|nr:carbohydrate kinase family protein [Eubacteriales bacterium]